MPWLRWAAGVLVLCCFLAALFLAGHWGTLAVGQGGSGEDQGWRGIEEGHRLPLGLTWHGPTLVRGQMGAPRAPEAGVGVPWAAPVQPHSHLGTLGVRAEQGTGGPGDELPVGSQSPGRQGWAA